MPLSESAQAGVTVIIPCFNYSHYLSDAINSCLSQSHGNLEVLVVDDGSTDDTAAVASSFGPRVRCVTQENQGLGATRNSGLREARHDLVIFLDADDCLAPGAVEYFLHTYFSSEHKPAVIAGCTQEMNAKGESLGKGAYPSLFEGVRRVTLDETIMISPFSPIVLAERSFLLSLGGFETNDATYRGSEDRDLWIRVAASDRALCLMGKVTAIYRVHQASMSHNGFRQSSSSQAVLARAQARFGSRLPPAMWNQAWAYSYFQAAIINSDCGRHWQAFRLLLRSLLLAPQLHHPSINHYYGSLFRVRRLARQFLLGCRGK
jgi:glycosyltransferase involved in cell wall biosynthesis